MNVEPSNLVSILRGTFYGNPVLVDTFEQLGEEGSGLVVVIGSKSWKLSKTGNPRLWKLEITVGERHHLIGPVFPLLGVVYGQLVEELFRIRLLG